MGVNCQPSVTDTRKMKSLTFCLLIAAITAQISAWQYAGPKECPCEIFEVVGTGEVEKLSKGGEYQKVYNYRNRLGTNGAIWRQVKDGDWLNNAIVGTSSWGDKWSIGTWSETRRENIKTEIMAKLGDKCKNWVWRQDTGRKCRDPKIICPAGPQLKSKWMYKPKGSRWRNAGNTVKVTCKKRESKMQIFVRLLNNKRVTLTVMSANTIEDVKDMIQKKERFATDQRKLKFKGEKLDDGKTLSYYNIQKKSTLYLVDN